MKQIKFLGLVKGAYLPKNLIDQYMPKIGFFAYLTIFQLRKGILAKYPPFWAGKKIIPIFLPETEIWEEGQNKNKTQS